MPFHVRRLGDLAAAARVDRHDVMIGESAGHEDQPFVVDQRRDELLGGSVEHPKLLAGVRVITGDALAAGEHHLRAAVDLADDRRAVAARLVLARRLPDRLARRPLQSGQVRLPVVIAVDDQQVFEHDRA